MKKSNRVVALSALAVVLAFSGPASAEHVRNIRAVLVPERNIFNQYIKYNYMSDYISAHMPVKFHFKVMKDYRDTLDALYDGDAEVAVFGSFLMAHGIIKHGFIPLVRPVWKSGDSYYGSVIFTRAGSGVTGDLSTWKGRSFAFANKHTSAGFFYPMYLLKTKGSVKTPEKFFSNMMIAGSHDAAVWMVSNGFADIGAAKNTVFDETMRKNPELEGVIKVLYTGGRFPDATFAVPPEMDPDLRQQLRETLLEMNESPRGREVLEKFGARKFIPSEVKDYNTVLDTVAGAGFDIRTIKVVKHSLRKQDTKGKGP